MYNICATYIYYTDVTHEQDIYSLFDALRQNRPKKGLLWGGRNM
jgi:hypothetical protein